MKAKKDIEEFLKIKILPDLKKSRGGFDGIHTLEVVDWIKRIIRHNPQLKLDQDVLLIAAYAHDWGYADLFRENEIMRFERVEGAKKLHMELGAKKLKRLLKDDFFSFLDDSQKERAIHLVAVHDKKFEITDTDELILMEADMLSSLDINTSKPIFDAKSNEKFMKAMLTSRIPKFFTEFSKKEAERLAKEREDYYNKCKK
ncbi:MAG: HD domain-containing protein [Parcubacteria group bacterium]|jgi:HD superfamily phosphodiesterase